MKQGGGKADEKMRRWFCNQEVGEEEEEASDSD